MTKAEEWAALKAEAKRLGIGVSGKKKEVLIEEVRVSYLANQPAQQAQQQPQEVTTMASVSPEFVAPAPVFVQPGEQGPPAINTTPPQQSRNESQQPMAPVQQQTPMQEFQFAHPQPQPLQPPPVYGQPEGNQGEPPPLIMDQGNIMPTPDPNAVMREQLLKQLAQLDGAMGLQSTRPTFGPNYRGMSHTMVKTLCVSAGIIDRTGTMESMVTLLQGKDRQMGLAPFPEAQQVAPVQTTQLTRPIQMSRLNTVGAPISGAIHIQDAQGRRFASVYLSGGTENGQAITLDMETHARRIVDLFNAG